MDPGQFKWRSGDWRLPIADCRLLLLDVDFQWLFRDARLVLLVLRAYGAFVIRDHPALRALLSTPEWTAYLAALRALCARVRASAIQRVGADEKDARDESASTWSNASVDRFTWSNADPLRWSKRDTEAFDQVLALSSRAAESTSQPPPIWTALANALLPRKSPALVVPKPEGAQIMRSQVSRHSCHSCQLQLQQLQLLQLQLLQLQLLQLR
jgi:hypothetical protein